MFLIEKQAGATLHPGACFLGSHHISRYKEDQEVAGICEQTSRKELGVESGSPAELTDALCGFSTVKRGSGCSLRDAGSGCVGLVGHRGSSDSTFTATRHH